MNTSSTAPSSPPPDRRGAGSGSGPRVIVVGAGAAGLIAAKRAAEKGARVTLIEKNERIGMKILISGGGKCNLTHAGSMEDVRAAFRQNEARFLKPAFYRYSNDDFLNILHERGIRTYVRPDGRVFPVEPSTARDVVAALGAAVREAGVEIVTMSAVTGLVIRPVPGVPRPAVPEGERVGGAYPTRVAGVRTHEHSPPVSGGAGGGLWEADAVIVAVGGSSYPATGATGDGWRWVADAGHSIAALRAALAPLYLADAKPEWSGIALRDVVLRARAISLPLGRAGVGSGGKEYARWRGDLLFTHKGLSGPCALGISREVAERMAAQAGVSGVVEVDLIPDMPFEALTASIRATLSDFPRRTAASVVAGYLPDRLQGPFLAAADVDPAVRGAHMSSKMLSRLVNMLKGWNLGPVRSVPLERGEVVAGGIALDEVDPQSMRSRLVEGLYLCGEILDIAGPVGGYNLQAAWSTGFVAGEAAAGIRH